jgi:surface polysaccharide O-acyltransferase-like enzyme
VVRGIAIIGVVFLHSSFEHRFDPPTLAVCGVLARVFDWAVLAFFFLSGLLLDERQAFAGLVMKRIRSLLLPFLAYNIFYNLALGILQLVTCKHFGGFQWDSSLWAFGWFRSPAFQLYFLPYLFGITVAVFLLCRVIPARGRWLMVLGGISAMLWFYQSMGWPGWSYGPEWTKLPLYFIAFLLGVVGRPSLEKTSWQALVPPLMICVILALVSPHLCLRSLWVPPIVCIVVSMVHPWWKSKMLLQIGRSSAAIYLWHTPILLPALTAMFALANVPALLNLGLSVVLTVSVCVVLRQVLTASTKGFLKG